VTSIIASCKNDVDTSLKINGTAQVLSANALLHGTISFQVLSLVYIVVLQRAACGSLSFPKNYVFVYFFE